MHGNALLCTAALATGLALAGVAQAQFKLTSPDIKPGATIADEQVFNGFGCSGKNISPALQWSGAPKEAKSFALLVHDPHAPTGGAGWWHWIVVNIPAGVTELPKNAGQGDGANLPPGAISGVTDFGAPGYGGALSTQGRQAASLSLHALRAQGGKAGCAEERHGIAGRLYGERELDQHGDSQRPIRSAQMTLSEAAQVRVPRRRTVSLATD